MLLLALLQRESTGAALSELSRGGVLLSSDAASDLSHMMASIRKQIYRRRLQSRSEKLSLSKKAAAAEAEKHVEKPGKAPHRPEKTLNAKVSSRSYMRRSSMLKARGKRGN